MHNFYNLMGNDGIIYSGQNQTLNNAELVECPLIRNFSDFDNTRDEYPDRAFCSRPLSRSNGCIFGYGFDGCVDTCESDASISFCPVNGLITEEKLREFERASEILELI